MPISGPFRSLPTAASPSSQLRPNVLKVFWNLYLLPVVFLALLSNVSALTMSPRPAPTCPNTAFHALEVLNPEAHRQEAESPVCCLRPLPPIPKEHGEPPDENTEPELLSFEEWKLKMSKESSAKMQNTSSAPLPSQEVHLTNETVNFSTSSNASSINASSPSHTGESTMDSALLPPSLEQPRTFHHSQVPLTDRFNYASTDCSARIHLAHKGAQSPGAILSSKKDRYMLSPCSTGDKFVVVELCDDIRIDTVQLANFEFFSGVFKDFSLSFAKTYSTSLASWTPAGTFRAKNVRNVQSFHPPSTIRDFYRFIRIDFESHYGSEYYCPVSLLRVYGLTHLEQWKWEKWEEEWAERMAAAGQPVLLTAKEENEYDPTNEHVTTAAESTTIQTTDEPVTPQILDPGMQHQLSKSVNEITGLTLESSSMSNSLPSATSLSSSTTSSIPIATFTSNPINETLSLSPISSETRSTTTIIPTVTTTSSLSHYPTGESIYRTIMNRLNSLETNHTLYRRYFEDQMGMIREVVRRLGEEGGRREALTNAQTALLQKTIRDWERRRERLEGDYNELVGKVEKLADDIRLEKQLGIAQLTLLLLVLVFLGLTRGSNHEPLFTIDAHGRGRRWVGEFGRRTLSLGGFRSSRSQEKPGVSQKEADNTRQDPRHVAFPLTTSGMSTPQQPKLPSQRVPATAPRSSQPLQHHFPSPGPHTASGHPLFFSQIRTNRPRSRTPSLRKRDKREPSTPTVQRHRSPPPALSSSSKRPPLARASSSHLDDGHVGGSGHVPRSARKFARSAHLHEVNRKGPRESPSSANESRQDENQQYVLSLADDEDGDQHAHKMISKSVESSPLAQRRLASSAKSSLDAYDDDLTLFFDEERRDGEVGEAESDIWVTDNESAGSPFVNDADVESESEVGPILWD